MNICKLRYKLIGVIFKTSYGVSSKRYYEILKVKPDATAQQIKASYYSLVKQYHPDLVKTNQDKIKIINQAYSVLSHQQSRKKYDSELFQMADPTQSKSNRYHPYQRPFKRRYYKTESYRQQNQTKFSTILLYNFGFGLLFTLLIMLIYSNQNKKEKNAKEASNAQLKKFTKIDLNDQFRQSLMGRSGRIT